MSPDAPRRPATKSVTGRRVFVVLATALAAFVVFARQSPQSVVADGTGKAELVVVTFSSAWCAPCRLLKPRLAAAVPKFQSAPVRFVELDYTFGPEPDVSGLTDVPGAADFVARSGGATGYTALLDADTGEIISTLTSAHSQRGIENEIHLALSVASASRAP